MLNKIILFIVLLFTINTVQSQTTNFWITNPSIKGKLTFQNGWTLVDTTSGLKINSDLWIGGSSLYLGGLVIKDSAGFVVMNKTIKLRPLPGDPDIKKWITNADIADTTIDYSKIKKNTITTSELAPSLKDSIFSSNSSGVIDLKLETLKERYDRLFNSKGDFKSTVFTGALDYDTSTNVVKLDTSLFLKAADSARYLATTDIDTSLLMHKYDSTRFVSGETFLPRSDTILFVRWDDTAGFVSQSTADINYWSRQGGSALDTANLLKVSRTDIYWPKSELDINDYLLKDVADTTYANINDIDTTRYWNYNDQDTNNYWNKTDYDPAKFWTNAALGGNLDTSLLLKQNETNVFWPKNGVDKLDTAGILWKNRTDIYWPKSAFDIANYLKINDTTIYWSRARLDTSQLLHLNRTDIYWSKGELDINDYLLKDVADTTYVNVNDIDTSTFKIIPGNIDIKDFGIDPIKLDSSKIGEGIKFNPTSGKLELNYETDLIKVNDTTGAIETKTIRFLEWADYVTSDYTSGNRWLTRSPDTTASAIRDAYGYTMNFDGIVEYYYMNNKAMSHSDLQYPPVAITFVAGDYLNLLYDGANSKLIIRKNGSDTDPLNFIGLPGGMDAGGIVNFGIKVVLDD